MQPLFLGVDGGGTKTDLLLAGARGAPVRRLRLGGGNVSALGEERAAEFYAAAIAEATAGFPAPAGAFLGLAGSTADGIGARVEARLRARFPNLPLEIGPDIRCVIGAAEADGGCTAAILGTGSCVYADDGAALHRYGGWGWFFGDPGSGSALGRDAVRARLAFEDGAGPGGPLVEAIGVALGRPAFDSIRDLVRGAPGSVARFAPLVLDAAAAGDPVARGILARNVEGVAALVRAARAAHPAAAAGPLVLGGGLCARADLLGPALRTALGPDSPPLLFPTRDPVFGAHRRAVRLFGA
ncbi:MAG: hypothetical protein IJV65_06345 [Kiritimatiellae bacterium]|nr:hypothetical protein [Kiritimatiellia bacterium]